MEEENAKMACKWFYSIFSYGDSQDTFNFIPDKASFNLPPLPLSPPLFLL